MRTWVLESELDQEILIILNIKTISKTFIIDFSNLQLVHGVFPNTNNRDGCSC